MTRQAVGDYYSTIVHTGQGRPPEDLWRGSCLDPVGVKIMDYYLAGRSGGVEMARRMCNSCPVIAECGAWVARAEKPAGKWDGMYAAMTPSERKQQA